MKKSELKSILDKFNLKETTSFFVGEREIKVHRYLSLSEISNLVEFIVSTCCPDGLYNPALYDFAWRIGVIAYYTDIQLPDSQDKLEKLAYHPEIYRGIISSNNNEMYESIRDAVIEKIEMKKQVECAVTSSTITPNPINDLVERLLMIFDDTKGLMTESSLNKIDTLMKKFSDLEKYDVVKNAAKKAIVLEDIDATRFLDNVPGQTNLTDYLDSTVTE